jgi:hypothetical protein
MGVVLFHARISTIGGIRRECSVASVSSVIPLTPRRRAKSTKSSHRSAGMELRAFQEETVDLPTPQASATSLVPPSASMIGSQLSNMPDVIVRKVRTRQGFITGELKVSSEPAKIENMADELCYTGSHSTYFLLDGSHSMN